MKKLLMSVLSATLSIFLIAPAQANSLEKVDYQDFTVWLNCDAKAASLFAYKAKADGGNHKRRRSFKLDDEVSRNCTQHSTKTYNSIKKGWDLGHMVPANHMDHSEKSIYQSNYMTNITPQTKELNRGAWLATEMLIECYRDIEPLMVIGGAVYNDPSNDYFVQSHGAKTPEYLWKIIYTSDKKMGWVFPNVHNGVKRSDMNDYVMKIEDISEVVGFEITTPENAVEKVWAPQKCDRS